MLPLPDNLSPLTIKIKQGFSCLAFFCLCVTLHAVFAINLLLLVVFSVLNSNPSNEHAETPVIERIIEVYPPDYVTLKEQAKKDLKTISDLQHRCRSLEHIFAFCDISKMSRIIHDYKSMSEFYLAQLSAEIEIYRFSGDKRDELLDFINYLRSTAQDIENMLSVDKQGADSFDNNAENKIATRQTSSHSLFSK